MYRFEFIQELPITIQEAWNFFSNPQNLRKITPPFMNFIIINDLPHQMYEGLFIEYRVSPVAGIPMEWVTEITHVKPPLFFIDEQRKGPYSIWHHEHHFEEIPGGTKMKDILYYSVPFGWLGKIINNLVIKRKVLSIFEYRKIVLHNMFVPMK
jgi:ligand-binding SRPBCC domain-containing protein